MLVAVLLIAGGIYLWSFQPTIEEQKQQQLEGAYLEGSPEFEAYDKQIIIIDRFGQNHRIADRTRHDFDDDSRRHSQ